jgi:hypothetical protein
VLRGGTFETCPTGRPSGRGVHVIQHAIDFRRIYAALLDGWLKCPSDKVLSEKFEPLAVL